MLVNINFNYNIFFEYMLLNYFPPATKYLVKNNVFIDNPVTIIDIGALGGLLDHFKVFGDKQSQIISFEPHEPNQSKKNNNNKNIYLENAVGANKKDRNFYIAENSSASSLFPFNKNYSC